MSNALLATSETAFAVASRAMTMVRGAPLTILMYHAVIEDPLPHPDYCFIPVDEFSAQMAWLANRRIRVASLVDAVTEMEQGRLKEPTVVITLDDGYRNNVNVALPVLERHGFPATIFLTTGLTGDTRALWPSRLNIALAATSCHELAWSGTTYPLADVPAREAALPLLQAATKLQAGDRPAEAVAEIERRLGTPVDPSVPRDSPFAMMDAADIHRAIKSGLVEFGAHTITHPILSHLDDERLATELNGSLDAVEELTGLPCRSFAYPNGRSEDFDDRAMRHLSARGVNIAVSTISGANRRGVDTLRLMRHGVGPDMNPVRFAAAAYGLPLEAWAAVLRGH